MRGVCLGVLLVAGAVGAAADEAAVDILRKVDGRDRGEDLVATLELVLTDRAGDKRLRTGKIYRRSEANGRSKQITAFLSPSNIRNTAFLTIDNDGDDDFMWLYLPALRKTKRVPPANRGSNFVGTDFSNEDVKIGFEYEDYDAEILERSTVDGVEVATLRVDPRTDTLKRDLGFDHSVVMVRLDSYIITDQVFYRRGELIKKNHASDIERIDDIWTARELSSHDVVNDHRTVLRILDMSYNTGIPESFFTKGTLAREIYR